jgi:hypothetical protein
MRMIGARRVRREVMLPTVEVSGEYIRLITMIVKKSLDIDAGPFVA